jgi:thioredoxin-dependent peroxiredoxin
MKAFDFKLKDKDGKTYSLKEFKKDYIVLYFYPTDSTPGCTLEAKEFNDHLNDFKRLNTQIIGISGGDEKTKTKFCDKHNLKLLLLSDTDFLISKRYKVYKEKSFLGKRFLGIVRTTFVLDKSHNIIKQFDKVNPIGHAKEVLKFIKGKT